MSKTTIATATVNADAGDMYAMFASPSLLARLPRVTVDVTRTATAAQSTVGLQRRVSFPGGYLLEEITELDEPARFGYRIRAASLPFRHEFGEVRFRSLGGGRTVAEWETRFSIPAGRLAGVAEAALGPVTKQVFLAALKLIARHSAGAAAETATLARTQR